MRPLLIASISLCALTSAYGQASHATNLDEKLFEAIHSKDPARVKLLLKQGANPNAVEANDWPALIIALEEAFSKPSIEVVEALLDAGANPNAVQSGQGYTPLHQAVSTQVAPASLVELLISHGANIEAQMPEVGTPLHGAARSGRIDIAKVLLAHGANLEAKTIAAPPRTADPFLEGVKGIPKNLREQLIKDRAKHLREDQARLFEGNRQSLERLGEKGYDQLGRTPLISAATSYSDTAGPMVKFLLERGAKVDAVDSVGRTALHEAATVGNANAVRALLAGGANVDARTKNGMTPLILAIKPTPYAVINVECVDALLRAGADPNARTNDGRSALDVREERLKQLIADASDAPADRMEEAKAKIGEQTRTVENLLKHYSDQGWRVPTGFLYLACAVLLVATLAMLRILKLRRAKKGETP